MKAKAHVNVYLLLQKENQLLLSLRENTGYEDGNWSLVSGHVEDGEAATHAIIREAKEEVGIEIAPEDLEIVHVMHRKTNRENIDIFMTCSNWEKQVTNEEPHKCGGLQFFSQNNFPENMISYIQKVLTLIQKNIFFSEWGWEEHPLCQVDEEEPLCRQK